MDEYIKREMALEAIDEYFRTTNPDDDEQIGVLKSRRIIRTLPAADVAPVRHGRWIFGKELPCSWGQIPKNKYHLYCSECLEQAFNRSEDNDPDFDVDTLYCPNCGCKMNDE